MTSDIPGHVHITEREGDGTWEDCTWCAGLEFYRDAIDSAPPATHAEAEALRAASGKPPTGGSNLGDLRRGVAARYHKDLPAAINNKAILAHLTPGTCAVLQGSMSAFGPDHPLSVYDRNFDGGHAVYVANVDGTYLWCDPEAPTKANVPVTVTAAQITKFVNAFNGEAIVAPILALAHKDDTTMYPITKYLPGYAGTVKPNSNVRAEPHIKATKFRTTSAVETQTLIGTVKGDVDPANGSDVWYMWWANGRYEFTAKDNVPQITAPSTDDGYTKATQDAAVAAQKAADLATLAQEKAKAVADEQARIRGVLGI